jgi:hypothetical protein
MDDDTLMTAADHEALVAELAALEGDGRRGWPSGSRRRASGAI